MKYNITLHVTGTQYSWIVLPLFYRRVWANSLDEYEKIPSNNTMWM